MEIKLKLKKKEKSRRNIKDDDIRRYLYIQHI